MGEGDRLSERRGGPPDPALCRPRTPALGEAARRNPSTSTSICRATPEGSYQFSCRPITASLGRPHPVLMLLHGREFPELLVRRWTDTGRPERVHRDGAALQVRPASCPSRGASLPRSTCSGRELHQGHEAALQRRFRSRRSSSTAGTWGATSPGTSGWAIPNSLRRRLADVRHPAAVRGQVLAQRPVSADVHRRQPATKSLAAATLAGARDDEGLHPLQLPGLLTSSTRGGPTSSTGPTSRLMMRWMSPKRRVFPDGDRFGATTRPGGDSEEFGSAASVRYLHFYWLSSDEIAARAHAGLHELGQDPQPRPVPGEHPRVEQSWGPKLRCPDRDAGERPHPGAQAAFWIWLSPGNGRLHRKAMIQVRLNGQGSAQPKIGDAEHLNDAGGALEERRVGSGSSTRRSISSREPGHIAAAKACPGPSTK